MDGFLLQFIVFLAAAAIGAPLGKRCHVGSILGYLFAGIVISASGLSDMLGDPEDLRHTAELGVAMFLFLVGLELRPRRLWAMRNAVFGAGGMQVGVTIVAFTLLALYTLDFGPALIVGLALSLSSTAFALQTLDEKGELTARHGRLAFSVLLFQDIAAIPMIAMVPFLALNPSNATFSFIGIAQAILGFAAIILAGRYLLNPIYRIIATTGVREAMTACALLTIVAVVYLMDQIGLSASLGAFMAGILLADSEFRHQIESDIAPFEGLLLGLFFITVGMSLDLDLLLTEPGQIVSAVAIITFIKVAILYGVGRSQDLSDRSARRLALVLSQGGEFGFVLLAAAASGAVIDQSLASGIAVAITISMAITPLLLLADEFITDRLQKTEPRFDTPPKADGHVVIAGFGRFGQIVARILRATKIPFTALDINAEQVNLVNQFGNKIYYGDASRLGILEAARTQDARAFVLAIDDVETSIRTAQVVRAHFPHVPIYARARNRQHVHRLMDLGIEEIERETFPASLELTKELLRELGTPDGRARWIIEMFKESDERRLYDDYKHYTDLEKVQLRARKQTQELEELFAQDVADDEVKPEPPVAKKAGKAPKASEGADRTAKEGV
jgi:monovalent cation:proton antiporter-2 (CPA2) family protein